MLSLGNMPYTITVEDIKAHFATSGETLANHARTQLTRISVGETPTVRLLTPKPTSNSPSGQKQPPKSKGCAFIEFTQPLALQAALKKHQSELGGRKINVELTAGGGGNSEQRRKKIQDKRKMLDVEREKAAKNKQKKKGGEDGAEVEKVDGVRKWGRNKDGEAEGEGGSAQDGQPKTRKAEIVTKDGKVKKVRDRRLVKKAADEKKAEANRAKKAAAWMTGANAVKLG